MSRLQRSLGLFDIRDFGAKGDGVTDDGPAIQAAMNAATTETPPSRAGRVFVPPTTASWRVATPLVLTFGGLTYAQNTFTLEGCGADGPIMVDVGNAADLFTLSQSGEFFQTFIKGLGFLTSDNTQTTVDCRDLLNLTAAGPSTIIVRDCHNIGTFASRAMIHTLIGNFKIENWFDTAGIVFDGVNPKGYVLVDGSDNVYIDNLYAFWQGQFRNVGYFSGTIGQLVYVVPMATGTFNGNNEGTLVDARHLNAFVRTTTLFYCQGDATHIARSLKVSDSFFNVGGGDLMYFDNVRKLSLQNINLANSAVSRIEFGAGVLENVHIDEIVHTPANAIQLWADVTLTGTIEMDRSDINIIRTSGFTPNAGPLTTPIFSKPSGVRCRGRNAAVALAVNLLVKPDGAGSYIKLADGDDGNLATGVSQTATVAVNVVFLAAEMRGQEVTFATDGTAIAEGAPIYASQLAANGGKVSAVVAGKQIGIATAAAAAGLVTGTFV